MAFPSDIGLPEDLAVAYKCCPDDARPSSVVPSSTQLYKFFSFFLVSLTGRLATLTMAAATKLRKMVEDPQSSVVAPGVYDGFSARIALEVGFDCIYMVRFGSVTASICR